MWFDDVNVDWDSPGDSLLVSALDALVIVFTRALPFAAWWSLNCP